MDVHKFGGSCIQNGRGFHRAAGLITSFYPHPVVILSAVNGVTDVLHHIPDKALESEKYSAECIQRLKTRHEDIIEESLIRPENKKPLIHKMDLLLKKLEKVLRGISYTGEVTPFLRAHVLSYGERFSVHILTAVINSMDVRKAVAMEADAIGIVTDDRSDQAAPRLNDIRRNLQHTVKPVIDSGYIPVITGYFGRSRSGKTTTFGRNGTDLSAAVIASALTADSLFLWKDVEGFMSADPRIIQDAQPVRSLSYDEAAELSYFGAHILHPRTIEPLSRSKIPVFIKNFQTPNSSGTSIGPAGYLSQETVKSVTCNKSIAVLKVQGAEVGCRPGVIAALASALSETGINIYTIITSQTCINLIIGRKDADFGFRCLQKLQKNGIEKIRLIEDLSLVAVVGKGLRSRYGVAARIFTAVARRKINIEMVSSGASAVAHYILLKTKHADAAVTAIHETFFTPEKRAFSQA